ncbi:ATP-dependent Clp protease adapter ClpS [Orbus sturtevantii]|uniref:ATP-dependent Clp protease adapter ClpS n=1 Tax=Orbus sturtevantii TaxID=3074109 RepID=UPI00370D2DAE
MSKQQVVDKLNVKNIAPPAKYKVILHNDDYTTMDFVIEVLMHFFNHDEHSATEIMLAVHKQGKGICGIYSAEIAETKVFQVTHYATEHQFPLLCTMEKVSS